MPASAAGWGRPSAALIEAFNTAMSIKGGFEEKDAAWSRAVELAPENSAAWSNRGTVRLQYGKWGPALEDLRHAYELEAQQQGLGNVDSVLLNNLGNAEGAAGLWEDALGHYQQAAARSGAAGDTSMEAIAGANAALAAFEMGRDAEAVAIARRLTRRDPAFLDARCALVALLWGSRRRSDAEDEWESLQQAQDGLGAALYNRSVALQRVSGRWPPRAYAALSAFLQLSDTGSALGYDLQQHTYTF